FSRDWSSDVCPTDLVGALVLLRHGDRWVQLDESTGLFPGSPFQILEGGGYLWVSSMHGVYRLALADLDAFAGGNASRVEPQMLLNERGMPNGGQPGLCCNGSGPSGGLLDGHTPWLPTRYRAAALDTADR